MVLAAFLISSAAVLVALALIQGAQNSAKAKAREALEAEISTFIDDVKASDDEHATGRFEGLPVTFAIGHYQIDYTVQLPHSVLPFSELAERFASPALKRKMKELEMTIDAKDRIVGSVAREPGLGENLVTIGNRLPVALELVALRVHAPGVLLSRLESARSAYDIDQILVALTTHFPEAPETEEAIEVAASREHAHPDRIRERANRWLKRVEA
jgi:hypothetical protein